MKRTSIFLVLIILLPVLLTGCGCQHEWAEAACDTPKTCAKCGQTEGEALGHTWVEATCAEAKHCELCGKTEGEPLQHTLTEANYQQPATCTVCGAEVGEPLEAYFEKMGVEINVTEPGVPYEYKCRAFDKPDHTVTGIMVPSIVETFPSAEGYEAMEGYEWKRVEFAYFIPESEMEYGGYISARSTNYYESKDEAITMLSDGEDSPFIANYCGNVYDKCIERFTTIENIWAFEETFLHTRCWVLIMEYAFRVPVGYDGVVMAAYHNTPEIMELDAAGKSTDDLVMRAPDTLFFRLD